MKSIKLLFLVLKEKYLLVTLFCWLACPLAIYCQQVREIDRSTYIQALSNILSNDIYFVNKQDSLLSVKDVGVEYAEEIFFDWVWSDQDKGKAMQALACFHLLILHNKESACKIMTLSKLITSSLPNIYRSRFLNCENTEYLLDLYKRNWDQLDETPYALKDMLCGIIEMYCNDIRYTNNDSQLHSISEDNLSNYWWEQIRYENERYSKLHNDFDNIFRRSSLDQQINKNTYLIESNRIGDYDEGFELTFTAYIPNGYRDDSRKRETSKIFNCFFATLSVLENRFSMKFSDATTNISISVPNQDIDIASILTSTFEKQFNINSRQIDLQNSDIGTLHQPANHSYIIKIISKNFFERERQKMYAKIKEYENIIENINSPVNRN